MNRLVDSSRNYLFRCRDYSMAKDRKEAARLDFIDAVKHCGYDSVKKQHKAAPHDTEELAKLIRDIAAKEEVK